MDLSLQFAMQNHKSAIQDTRLADSDKAYLCELVERLYQAQDAVRKALRHREDWLTFELSMEQSFELASAMHNNRPQQVQELGQSLLRQIFAYENNAK